MLQEFTFSKHLFGTHCYLTLVHDNIITATTIAKVTFQNLKTYELTYSRFLPTSELSRLNTRGSLTVNPEFMSIISKAKLLYEQTGYIYNPLVQVQTLGYGQSRTEHGIIVDTTSQPPLPYSTDFSAVVCNNMRNSITLAPTQKLDLGGILKGYLASKIANTLHHTKGVAGVILNIGGDLAAYGHDQYDLPFACTIYNPVTETESRPITLHNDCLATSGTYNRHWLRAGQKTNHIIDPTTRHNPETSLISASIIHKDGSCAEAFAKVFLIAGSKRAQEILTAETYFYYLIDSDGTITTNLNLP